MLNLTDDELKVRLRRTITNKLGFTVKPMLRKEIRKRAFKDERFIKAVDNVADALFIIHSEVGFEAERIAAEREKSRTDIRAKRKAKKEANHATV